MAAGRIVLPPYMPTRNRDGLLVDQARLTVYENETTVKATIYSDVGLTTPQANPVIANSSGQFPPIWAEAGTPESPVLYSLAIADASGASVGNPGVFDNWQPSVDGETAASVLAEAAADSAAASAIDAAASATVAEDALDEILAAAAASPETLPLLNKANLNGGNVASTGNAADFRQNIGAVGSAALAAGTGGALVGFIENAVAAEAETVQAVLRSLPLRPESFGPLGTATQTTATLLKAMTAAMTSQRPIELSGDYIINGPITPLGATNGGEIHIRIKGDATITVDASATAFNRVLFAESNIATNHSISGDGTLTIDCNNKAAVGLWLRHTEAATGGFISFNNQIRVLNANGGASDEVAAGIYILGRYEYVFMNSPYVSEVTRQKVAAESAGISVSGVDGQVNINNPYVKNIRTGAGSVDADGVKVFGRQSGGANDKREGVARINGGTYENCQGRSIKIQTSDAIVSDPVFVRDASVLVAIAQSSECDFQYGNGLVLNPRCEYYADGATSPLGSSSSVAVFQQVLEDAEMYSSITNAVVISDVEVPIGVLMSTSASAQKCTTVVDGFTMIPRGSFSGTMLGRALLAFDASSVAAKTTETVIVCKNTSAPQTLPVVGYTGYSSGDVTGTLSISVDRCSTSLPVAGQGTRAIHNLSGSQIVAFKSIMLGENPGFRNYYVGWSVCLKRLPAGTKLVVALGGSTAFVEPDRTTPQAVPWGTSGTLFLECKGISNMNVSADDTILEARLDNATVSPSFWFSQNGGINFGPIN